MFSVFKNQSARNLQSQIPGCSSRLCTIYGIERLIEEKTNCPACIDPSWHILVERWVVPQQCQEIEDDEAEAGECNLKASVQRAEDDRITVFTYGIGSTLTSECQHSMVSRS